MTKQNYCQLLLTCKNSVEASVIAEALLAKRLVACAKLISSVDSEYRWQGKIERDDEELLIMDSRLDLFDEIEAEVAKLHSYDTFVLQAVPVLKISKKAGKWLDQEVKNG
jgi:periplasmic divalent cation tolerance protein